MLQTSRARREETKQRLEEEKQLLEAAIILESTEESGELAGKDPDNLDPSYTEQSEPAAMYADQITIETPRSSDSHFPVGVKNTLESKPKNSQKDSSRRFTTGVLFSPYQEFEGSNFSDPRVLGPWDVADNLREIVDIEGPMLAKRAYDIYLRGCGIKRMGRDLKSIMNKSLQHAIRQDSIVVEDELDAGGLVHTFIRNKNTPPLVLRTKGSRAFEEIPPSEILVASYLAMNNGFFEEASNEHLHAILKLFDLKRLTTATGTRLLDILGMEFDYVQKWINENGQAN